MKFRGKDAKIVWEHSTHIGDAHATDMASEGMVNVVQLLKEQHLNDGVVYNPEHEKFGKDVPTILPKSYSDFIFLNETSELHPEHT